MANDMRLEQLRVAQEQAFTKKQEAYQAQQNSWKRLSDAHDRMDRAYDTKQSAYDAQEQSWQNVISVNGRNCPRIEYLNSAQEIAYRNMGNAFDRASSAHSSHEGASAKAYSEEGHRYQNEAKGYVEERRRLVEECKSARAQHEPYKRAFEEAKTVFGRAKDEYEQAKAAHEHANNAFKSAKTEFNEAAKAFQARLSELKADFAKKKENNRAIAAKAGVPYQYRDNVYVSKDTDGTVSIYFGGIGRPDGLGHEHYVMDSLEKVLYRRDPFDPHGAHNFTESVYWHKEKMSFDRDTGAFQTDNYIRIIGVENQKSKAHIAIDENGNITFVRDIGGEILYSLKNGIGYLPDNLDWSK